MKKILLLAFTIFSMTSVFSQSQRLVFVEEFTQASCPPCEATTPALNSLLNANVEKVIQLRYQTSWPGVDPMNADNPGEVQDRVDYYGVTGVPNLFFDGSEPTGGQFPILATQSDLDNAYAVSAPVAMTLSHTISEDLSTITTNLTITNEGTEAYNVAANRLRVAIVEELISYRNRPGSTSILDYDAVMKKFITSTGGMEIPEIAAGESWSTSWDDVAMPARVYDYTQIAVVAFIQNDDNRSMVQGAHSSPVAITGFANLNIEDITEISSDFCDANVSPTLKVTNTGDVDLADYNVGFVYNGSIVETKMSEGPLAGGASVDVTFADLVLPGGTSLLAFIGETSQFETAILDNVTGVIRPGKIGAAVETFYKDFEGDTPSQTLPASGLLVEVPITLYNFTAVDQALLGGANPLGGYSESSKSVSVNFWNWDNSAIDENGFMIIADQYLAPANLQLTFDYAYTSYLSSQDRLIVEVSTDCGASFDEIFNQAGSQLATASEVNNAMQRFLPSATDWETITADLSAYEGETILVRFRVVSRWGDMLYLDNIELRTATDVNELEADESLDIYPNPAATYVNVNLSTPNASNVQLRVIDMLGRTLKSENLGRVSGKLIHSLDVTTIPNGSYLLLMNVDGRDVVKRLSVAH